MNPSEICLSAEEYLGHQIDVSGLLTAKSDDEWFVSDERGGIIYIDRSYFRIDPREIGFQANLIGIGHTELSRTPLNVPVSIHGILVRSDISFRLYLINISHVTVTHLKQGYISHYKHHIKFSDVQWSSSKCVSVNELLKDLSEYQGTKLRLEGVLNAFRNIETGCIVREFVNREELARLPKILIGTPGIIGVEGRIQPGIGGNPYFHPIQVVGIVSSTDNSEFVAQITDVESFAIIQGIHRLQIWELELRHA